MLDNWVFIVGAILIFTAEVQLGFVLTQQYKTFQNKTSLQPLKRFLFGTILAFMLGALPLLFVYLNIVWFHFNNLWIIYVSVIANALSKNAVGLMLNLVYKFHAKEDDVL